MRSGRLGRCRANPARCCQEGTTGESREKRKCRGTWTEVPGSGAEGLRVSLDCGFNVSASSATQILSTHSGFDSDGGSHREEPGLGDGRKLGRILHVEEDVTTAGAIGFCE